jgi:transcriptional regulator with XRE-family HTH domain
MSRAASAPKPRPKQGLRLAQLRKAAGLSQIELAKAVGVPQQSIAYWETVATPPRSDVLPKMAKALGVRVEDILGDTPIHAVRRPGPVGRLQRIFEQASSLPRREQQLVADFVETLVERNKKAS